MRDTPGGPAPTVLPTLEQGPASVVRPSPITDRSRRPVTTPRRRPPLTRYFAVVSVVALLALGVALSLTTRAIMQEQALAEAIQSAEYVEAHVQDELPVQAHQLGVVSP